MWQAPLKNMPLIPVNPHPGSFGVVRKYDIHTGVDLYCDPLSEVFAVEDGEVIKIGAFTGAEAQSPWWHNTNFCAIKGSSGIVVYGEIQCLLTEGQKVKVGDKIGHVLQVLKHDKGKPMNMLHLELYSFFTEPVWWKLGEVCPKGLIDPTSLLTSIK